MDKRIIITIAAASALVLLVNIDGIANALLGFILAGVIPGTTIIVPVWIMIAFWCVIITIITTLHLESMLSFIYSRKKQTQRQERMPRRRYSNI